ncbi:dynein light chain Tctex2b [Micromonas pusilla CCMP1545]|jgi:hypothetical protein|uniref:Dynein light chain Tctex2b n=1 Tax=Micromonas pusilla (strain CCMP1545) TaxID=564608 RepID=C1MZI2_MICPC|nr:dynein light chain Tctex2b [Micromonas pusilla CCMP1545]EEH54608.1 dynein light chain Tctex2b [Micromonas pusilla CCMP1545]|tara:strand:- start:705 stop:1073 length:369 start_codon:yes stop_codon:yes gene_type:complete|eukprot:XP_003060958.1 dynein light chain Tctex2b [Micromonas pusilla CCMP1545]
MHVDRSRCPALASPLRPRFKPGAVKAIIAECLKDKLAGKPYDPDECSMWAREISDEIKQRVKKLGYERYKIVCQVVVGEQKGEGVRMGARCFWDPKTDNYAEEVFTSESIFACGAAFGIYLY